MKSYDARYSEIRLRRRLRRADSTPDRRACGDFPHSIITSPTARSVLRQEERGTLLSSLRARPVSVQTIVGGQRTYGATVVEQSFSDHFFLHQRDTRAQHHEGDIAFTSRPVRKSDRSQSKDDVLSSSSLLLLLLLLLLICTTFLYD